MDKSILIVVDMQENFRASKDPRTIKACLKQIRIAKENLNPILFVEYRGAKRTMDVLLNEVKNYAYFASITKYMDGGADKIVDYFDRCRINPKKLIICGVNTNYCVKDTVVGLAHYEKFEITVIKDACNTDALYPAAATIDAFKEMEYFGAMVA